MKLALLLFAASVASAIAGLPPKNSTAYRLLNKERDACGMIRVGDMRMVKEQVLEVYGSPEERALGESRTAYRWPNGVINYKIDPSLNTKKHMAMIKQGMGFWEAETCISFKEITDPSTPHIYIKQDDGCYSNVGYIAGRIREKKQIVSLEMPGCEQVNTICHELGHAIGLQHEMSRPDRDDHLNVFLDNTDEDSKNNFDIENENVWHHLAPYDFTSTMHYWIGGGAIYPNTLVVTPKDPIWTPVIDRSIRPSFYDYLVVNVMYECNKGCNLQCQNGGFATRSTAKGCHCLCPYDTTGSKCENKVPVDICSKVIEKEGILRPPNRNDPYDENPRCSYIIRAPKGKKVSLVFTMANLDCDSGKESFMIRNSDLSGDRYYKYTCMNFPSGRTKPMVSEENEMQIIHTGRIASDTFEAEIKFI